MESNQLSRFEQAFFSKCSWDTHFCMQLIAAGVRVFLQSVCFKDGEFLRLILSTKTKGHSLRTVSRS